MVKNYLNELLARLGLLDTNAVFFTSQKSKFSPLLAPEVRRKLELIGPDAYYAFNNQPYILFFDLSEETNPEREDEIHKQVWSFDSAPVMIVIKQADIEVFNAFYYEKQRKRLEKITADPNEILLQFSFWNIQSGRAWQWLQTEKYKDTINKKRVNQRLFDNIKQARQQLEDSGMSTFDANTTILRLIFIRYLIDRGVGIKKEFIAGESLMERRKSLSELIMNSSRLSEFFEYLNTRFNGALFTQKASFRLKREQGHFLSQIFDVRDDKSIKSLFDSYYFDVFDFSIIPVEVISGIYESVIDEETKDEDSAVYTPPFLVEYILEETVDQFHKRKQGPEFTLLDPACGSGIFLVQAYRRMVDEELRRGKLQSLESGRLRQIAENNLYGIDLNEQALLVASFSIYIAILDYKEPKEINTFRFPSLIGTNLFAANFFDIEHDYNDQLSSVQFDFILGNPPWKSKKGDKIHLKYISDNNLNVGRYEIAQTFLLRSAEFMSDRTKSAMIVTSTIFYNISSTIKAFKNDFLTRFYLDVFFDLSAVRRLVFESAISPATIVIYRKAPAGKSGLHIVKHFSVKSNIFLKHFKSLVIEKFDRKEILQQHFISYDWMFKVALYGNTLDYVLLKRMTSGLTEIGDTIDNKAVLFKGSGIKEKPVEGVFRFLIGRPLIENSQVLPYYTAVTEDHNVLRLKDVNLQSGRRKELFDGEHILLKAQTGKESEIIVSYCDKPAVFKHDVFGISSSSNTAFLKSLYAYFISDLHTYFQYLTNCSWGIATRPAIRLEEYLSFPYKEISEAQLESLLTAVNSLLKDYANHRLALLKQQNFSIPVDSFTLINQIIEDSYDIGRHEKDLINYVVEISRYQFQESKQKLLLKKVDDRIDYLQLYADVFFEEIEQLYHGEYLQAEIYLLNYFVAINFKMVSQKPSVDERIKVMEGFSDEKATLSAISTTLSVWDLTNGRNKERNIYIQKDIKGFEENSFYVIKPNEYKCWHRAIAWYDVAEIKSVIERAEKETLIENR